MKIGLESLFFRIIIQPETIQKPKNLNLEKEIWTIIICNFKLHINVFVVQIIIFEIWYFFLIIICKYFYNLPETKVYCCWCALMWTDGNLIKFIF